MGFEIERKFLVTHDGWRGQGTAIRICQGYLASEAVTVRVRRAGDQAFLTIKGEGGLVRPEFEYPIPLEDAEQLLLLCRRPLIEKIRHAVAHGGVVWQVDEFLGENAGLVIAEAELADARQELSLPDWIGAEVTNDPGYRNASLVRDPRRR
jgi:adenylate cyclase